MKKEQGKELAVASVIILNEPYYRLETVGQYHLGEFVNRFRHGSLVMKLPDTDLNIPTLIFGTVNGVIGAYQ
jgi:DNA damage-binding protein 1